jgi:hypothetical protein
MTICITRFAVALTNSMGPLLIVLGVKLVMVEDLD